METIARRCPRCRKTFAGPPEDVDSALTLHLQGAHGYQMAAQRDADREEAANVQVFEASR